MGLDVYAVTKYEVIESPIDEQKEDLYTIYQPDGSQPHLGENLKNNMVVDQVECGNSDCKGLICNELCKILDVAFDKHMEKAKDSEWFDRYKNMAACTKAAANSGGYLSFH